MKREINIHICPIKKFYLLAPQIKEHSSVVAVLCTTGNIDTSKLAGIKYCHIPFADVTDTRRSDAFRLDQAKQIRAFLDSMIDATELYFCCDGGESRSTALAAAWMHYSEQDEMKIWKNIKYHPNELVYYLQSVACGLSITREDANELVEYNRMLFHNAVSRHNT